MKLDIVFILNVLNVLLLLTLFIIGESMKKTAKIKPVMISICVTGLAVLAAKCLWKKNVTYSDIYFSVVVYIAYFVSVFFITDSTRKNLLRMINISCGILIGITLGIIAMSFKKKKQWFSPINREVISENDIDIS